MHINMKIIEKEMKIQKNNERHDALWLILLNPYQKPNVLL